MKFEKTWKKIVPQMIAEAYENSKRTFYRTLSPYGTSSCYFKGLTAEIFSGIDKIMLANGANYIGHYYPDNKSGVYKIIVTADCKCEDDEFYPYAWIIVPVTE